MRVLITGSNGQLGSEIKALAFYYIDLPELDICNFNELQSFIIKSNINV